MHDLPHSQAGELEGIVSTFENGWICRECWSANREFDGRCYRCHADRPADAGIVSLETAPQAPVDEPLAPAAVAPRPPEQKRVTSLVGAATPSNHPPGHCLRCGRRILDRASYCTGCGTQVSRPGDSSTSTTPSAPKAVRPSPSLTLPAVRMPSIRAGIDRALASVRGAFDRPRRKARDLRGALDSLPARLTDSGLSRLLTSAALLLISFALFALGARWLVDLSPGQVVFLVAGAAVLSGLSAAVATRLAVDDRAPLRSTQDRLRALDELRDAARITDAEHAAQRASVLARLSAPSTPPR